MITVSMRRATAVLVAEVEVDLDTGVEDSGLVRVLGAGSTNAGLVAEHDVDAFGSSDVDVVGYERFEEPAGAARVIEHQGAGHFDLAHR